MIHLRKVQTKKTISIIEANQPHRMGKSGKKKSEGNQLLHRVLKKNKKKKKKPQKKRKKKKKKKKRPYCLRVGATIGGNDSD